MLLTPWLLKWHGPHWAFGVPGVLMALATLVFWTGRKRFIHVPPGGRRFLTELSQRKTWVTLLRLAPLYLFLAMFWALFDQTGSTWIFQAQDMNRNFLGMGWLPSQVQSLNSLFVLSFIPLFAYGLYPLVSKIWKLTPLRKIGIGLFVMAGAFALVSVTQARIDAGEAPNIGWQMLSYALLTAAEVMVSIVALEFAYTQAPRTMKSLVMCFYLGAVALGKLLRGGREPLHPSAGNARRKRKPDREKPSSKRSWLSSPPPCLKALPPSAFRTPRRQKTSGGTPCGGHCSTPAPSAFPPTGRTASRGHNRTPASS